MAIQVLCARVKLSATWMGAVEFLLQSLPAPAPLTSSRRFSAATRLAAVFAGGVRLSISFAIPSSYLICISTSRHSAVWMRPLILRDVVAAVLEGTYSLVGLHSRQSARRTCQLRPIGLQIGRHERSQRCSGTLQFSTTSSNVLRAQ